MAEDARERARKLRELAAELPDGCDMKARHELKALAELEAVDFWNLE